MTHSLERAQAAERVRAAARRLAVAAADPVAETDFGGALSKDTPLGAVRATWRAHEREVVVVVVDRPAFLPEGTVRRLLEDGLRDALAS